MKKYNVQSFVNIKKVLFKIIFFLLILCIWTIISFFLFLYYLDTFGPLPDVKEYKAIPMNESSIIYDRNWVELYKIYSE